MWILYNIKCEWEILINIKTKINLDNTKILLEQIAIICHVSQNLKTEYETSMFHQFIKLNFVFVYIFYVNC